jgi:hypothetical protein
MAGTSKSIIARHFARTFGRACGDDCRLSHSYFSPRGGGEPHPAVSPRKAREKWLLSTGDFSEWVVRGSGTFLLSDNGAVAPVHFAAQMLAANIIQPGAEKAIYGVMHSLTLTSWKFNIAKV